ncbi:hypothetical protein TNCV_917121 [Trichonephila clavipes]|nr:hypothetical protein TNCV_917121 [Trichonephila clavipes]
MEPISSYITKLARNVFRSIENHDNPIIRAQTMFTYPHPKLKYAYATAKWQLPLKPPYKRLRRWHLKILISVPARTPILERQRADPRAAENPNSEIPGVNHVHSPAPSLSQAKLIILIFL